MPYYKIIEIETTGVIHIKTDSQYNNIKAEKVVVSENINVRLFGTINELLIIKKGARVYLHGTLYGKAENEGELYMY